MEREIEHTIVWNLNITRLLLSLTTAEVSIYLLLHFTMLGLQMYIVSECGVYIVSECGVYIVSECGVRQDIKECIT